MVVQIGVICYRMTTTNSVARLFLQNTKIVFCDEATSAIDETTESTLYQRLQETVPTVISMHIVPPCINITMWF